MNLSAKTIGPSREAESSSIGLSGAKSAGPSCLHLRKLPIPPSLNNSFYNNGHGGRSKSSFYTAWRTACGWEAVKQKRDAIQGPVSIAIKIEDGGSRADLDNLAKGPIDLLVTLRLIDGDTRKTVRKVSLEWADVEGMEIEVRSV